MDKEQRLQEEERIKAILEEGDVNQATEATMKLYGGEVYGFMRNAIHNDSTTEDLFQHYSIEVWKSLPSFSWKSSLRTWLYVLARRTLGHHFKRPNRERPLKTHEEDQIQVKLHRTATLEYQKTENRDKLWLLLEGYEPEDRMLIVMRVGQRMSWKEIVKVLATEDGLSDADVRTRGAKLRKRFERLKTKLRKDMKSIGMA